MILHKTITYERILVALGTNKYLGFCVKCGATNDCVKPVAREYVCDSCGGYAVYGAQELLLSGLYYETEEET